MIDFQSAVTEMEAGTNMVSNLTASGCYLSVLPGQKYIWLINTNNSSPVISASIFVPSVADIQETSYTAYVPPSNT